MHRTTSDLVTTIRVTTLLSDERPLNAFSNASAKNSGGLRVHRTTSDLVTTIRVTTLLSDERPLNAFSNASAKNSGGLRVHRTTSDLVTTIRVTTLLSDERPLNAFSNASAKNSGGLRVHRTTKTNEINVTSKQTTSLVDEVQDKSTRKAFYIRIILKEQQNGCWNIKYVKANLKRYVLRQDLKVN